MVDFEISALMYRPNIACIDYRLKQRYICISEYFNFTAPAVDCSNDFRFSNHYYHDQERGLRHHDGFVDCQAASGRYYVENHSSKHLQGLTSCHPRDGLCFSLTSNNNGGWWYELSIINGKHSYVFVT